MTHAGTRARLASSLLIFALAACGSPDESSEKDIGELPPIPEILTFGASPTAIAAGEAVTLAWTTRNVASLSLADGAGQPIAVAELDVAAGQVTVAPGATTSYTLTAAGDDAGRNLAYRTVTVRVSDDPVDAPTIDAFDASPGQVVVGGEVTLSWRTSNATGFVLKDDAGVEVDRGDAPMAAGSVTVRPVRATTTYTLVVTGPRGRASAEADVEVLGLPRVHRFFVQPVQPVAAGEEITLAWETSRAARVVIRDDADAVIVDTTTELSGSRVLTLARTTAYELTATGPTGEAGATVLARVAAKVEEFVVTPRYAREGDPITLSWKTSGAETVVLTGPGNFRFEVPAAALAEGTTTTALPASGDYVLAARVGDVTQTWSVFVERTEKPIIRSFTSNLAILTAAPDHPDVVSLSFEQDGGTTCTVLRNNQAVPTLQSFPCGRTGTVEVELKGAADLRLVATNPAGNDQETVHFDAVAPARIVAFARNPDRRLSPGATVELSWTVTDAVAVRMEKNGLPFPIGATVFDGSTTDPVLLDSTYALIAENSLGHLTVAELDVTAGAPVIEAFASTEPVVVPGGEVTFAWRCDGGETLVLRDAGNVERKSTEVLAEIDQGTVTFLAPETPGTYTYTLELANDAYQVDTATFDLLVTDGPLVKSLTASKGQIALATSVDIAWVVLNDAAGAVPTLALRDNFGNVYDLAGKDPNNGKVTVTPPEEGRHVFTLTATTPNTRPSSRDVTVEVTVAAKIVAFTADPPSAFTENGSVVPTVTLAWQTQNAVEVRLGEADAGGQPIPGSTFHLLRLADGATQAELDAGSFDVHPMATTRYLLRAVNRIGAAVDRVVTVLVDPPHVVSFVADPADIIAGESTTLSWETENATSVMLQPVDPVITPITNAFVDISGLPGAEPIVLSVNDSYQVVPFPDDFRFPFDGKLHAGMRVAMNGFLSFDTANTNASGTNQATFPTNATYNYVHLAPFWDVLQPYTAGTLFWHYDDVARTVTVMWKNWSYRTTSATFDMNIEVVLHENGSFEYRYGTMYGGLTSSGTDYSYYADAGYATIGFQNLTASAGKLLHYGNGSAARFPGGLQNKGWFFDLATPIDGSRQVTPESSRTYTLVAANADLTVSKPTDVRVWAVPAINVASIYPSGPQADVPFTVSWRSSNSSRIRLFDADHNLLCEKTDPAEVNQGSCALTLHDAGNQSVTLEAINGLERNAVTRTMNFVVFPRLQVEIFSASDNFISSGEQVTITWQGVGGFESELYACVPKTNHGSCTKLDISSQTVNAGTYTTNLTASKEFWFRLVDRLYRSEEASVNVWVDAPRVDTFTSTAKQVPAGTSVTLNWATTGSSSAKVENVPPGPPTELAGAPFLDISQTGTPVPMTGTVTSGYYTFDFPAGFTFEYFGKRYTSIQATTEGWATFDTSNATINSSNTDIPTSSTYNEVHLMPFWDSLNQKANGGVRYELRTDPVQGRFLIIQWTGFEFGTTSYNPADLNFQVLLYETGFVEYRFGTMTSTSTTVANREYAAGKGASIGLQNPDLSLGQKVLYNLATPPPLSNRSFRFHLRQAPDGTATVTPTETTTYRVCVTNASLYDACEEIRVVVVSAGDLLISELLIAPAVAAAEWFEVRNISTDPIDLAGFTIVSGTEQLAIPASPALVVPPNGFAVLARSADPAINGGLSPLFAYGNTIDLGDTADDIQLKLGSLVVDEVTWAADWPITANRSINFEPSLFNRAEGANDAKAGWCGSTTTYGGALQGNPGSLGGGCRNDGAFQYYLVDPNAGLPFIDIAQTGTAIPGLFDTAPYYSAPIPLGFTFPFFDQTFTEITVTKYGMLAPGTLAGTIATANYEIPDATDLPNGMIAPMWDVMYDQGTASIAYELRAVGGRLVMIVQWTNITSSSSTSDYGFATFQAQLWENGDIVFAYHGAVKSVANPTYQYCYGSSSTIGIENMAGDQAIQLFYGSTSTAGAPGYEGRSYRLIRK